MVLFHLSAKILLKKTSNEYKEKERKKQGNINLWKLRHFHCWLQWKTIAVNDEIIKKKVLLQKRKRCQHALNGDLHEFQYLFRISMETEGLLSPSVICGWWRKTFSDHPEIDAMISGWSSKFFYHHPCRWMITKDLPLPSKSWNGYWNWCGLQAFMEEKKWCN